MLEWRIRIFWWEKPGSIKIHFVKHFAVEGVLNLKKSFFQSPRYEFIISRREVKPFCFEIQTLFYAPALHCRYAPWLYPMVHFSPNIPSHAENCVREQSLAAAAGFRLCYDRIVRKSCAQHDNIHPFARDKKISVCFPLAYRKNGTTKQRNRHFPIHILQQNR